MRILRKPNDRGVWAVLALLFLLPSGTARAAEVLRVRYSVQGGKTRVVLDCRGKPRYRVVRFHNPERLALNMEGTRAGRKLSGLTISRGVVKRVRINKLSWGLQIVLDLRGACSWKDFTLSAYKSKPNRVVVDLRADRSASLGPPAGARTYVVAIDAGHGGMDPGAKGRHGMVEKEVALDITRRVADKLAQSKEIKPVLTRNKDAYLGLAERVSLAKRFGAEAFVSIHLNSARRRSARGTEVFFISPAGAAAKAHRLLADKSRAAAELGLQDGPSVEVLYMLLDVNQQVTMLRSSLLGESILKAMKVKGLPPPRGLKQRSFAVLKTVTVPSVIVETGFLTNPYDARILRSKKGRERIAAAIARGIERFFQRYPPTTSGRRRLVIHKVKRGETLWNIARRYGTTVTSIRKANKLGRSDLLHVGQKLLVFSEGS